MTCCPECSTELLVTANGLVCPRCTQRERLRASLQVLAKELGITFDEVVRRAIVLLERSTEPEPPPAAPAAALVDARRVG
jgi:hypothetical protein